MPARGWALTAARNSHRREGGNRQTQALPYDGETGAASLPSDTSAAADPAAPGLGAPRSARPRCSSSARRPSLAEPGGALPASRPCRSPRGQLRGSEVPEGSGQLPVKPPNCATPRGAGMGLQMP